MSHYFLERKEGIKLEILNAKVKKRLEGNMSSAGRKPAVEATLKFTSDSFQTRRRVVAHWYGTGTYKDGTVPPWYESQDSPLYLSAILGIQSNSESA